MKGKIALEEHFAVPETVVGREIYAAAGQGPLLLARLTDFYDLRLSEMDKYGIELAIVSLNSPGPQNVHDTAQAIAMARRANEALAEAIAKRPDRFRGFAALPMQDPDAAIVELTRCVKDYGFLGTVVNGFSQVGHPENVVYLDDPRYLAFWAAVQELDVPFYLHPREPLPSREPIYDGHPWLFGAMWAFGVETATHALRLMASGLFDRYPKLKVFLGHLGEGLPYCMWRLDHWIKKTPRGIPAKKAMSEYFRENFYITTSGNFRTQSLIDAILELGSDRILFSSDFPFDEMSDAAIWFDSASISEPDRLKIGRTNAIDLFKLKL
jgi:predicted TIM-barrel fold metal-dependent hydrolase